MSAVTLKVEFSVEGGSTAVLYDNAQTPMQQLPYGAQKQLRVQTDIKEQGLITIVASAVFTGAPALPDKHGLLTRLHGRKLHANPGTAGSV